MKEITRSLIIAFSIVSFLPSSVLAITLTNVHWETGSLNDIDLNAAINSIIGTTQSLSGDFGGSTDKTVRWGNSVPPSMLTFENLTNGFTLANTTDRQTVQVGTIEWKNTKITGPAGLDSLIFTPKLVIPKQPSASPITNAAAFKSQGVAINTANDPDDDTSLASRDRFILGPQANKTWTLTEGATSTPNQVEIFASFQGRMIDQLPVPSELLTPSNALVPGGDDGPPIGLPVFIFSLEDVFLGEVISGNGTIETVVPEPTSILLFGTGLVGVLYWRTRKSKQDKAV